MFALQRSQLYAVMTTQPEPQSPQVPSETTNIQTPEDVKKSEIEEEQRNKERELRNQDSAKREEELIKYTKELFENVSKYLQGELRATSGDYQLLENINKITKEKYEEMTKIAKGLAEYMNSLQEKYRELQPYLEKIDEIDASVTELEKVVALLDNYTLKLEEKIRVLKQAGKLPFKKETQSTLVNL
jgi:biogenesis of lysosome-related organelles complex 1 subunit 2